MGEKKKKELKAVNPMLFLVAIILIVAVASYIVPAGSYDRVYDAAIDREIVDPSSYHTVDRNPISLFTLLMSVSLGIQNAAYIIAFLLVIGGMFAILNGTKAIETGMANVVRAMKGKELLMIPVCMLVFGCGSAFCANFEEFLAFRLRRRHHQRLYHRRGPEHCGPAHVLRHESACAPVPVPAGGEHLLRHLARPPGEEEPHPQLHL